MAMRISLRVDLEQALGAFAGDATAETTGGYALVSPHPQPFSPMDKQKAVAAHLGEKGARWNPMLQLGINGKLYPSIRTLVAYCTPLRSALGLLSKNVGNYRVFVRLA